MTPIPCIARELGEFGDCWRACIATILDFAASDVPNFFHLAGGGNPGTKDCNKRAYELAREWLGERGLAIFRTYFPGTWSLEKLLDETNVFSPGVPMILHGEPVLTPFNEAAHAVVILDGRIAWDPSNAGLSGPLNCDCGDEACKGWWWIDVISPGANWSMGDLT
jgi:hypothetical protein